jgi:hypothetical protein
MDIPNEYINKDDYMLFHNNMTASENSRNDKSVSTKLMKIIILVLYIIFFIILILFFKKIRKDYRFIYLVLYGTFVYLFILYYIKVAYIISKFFENNLLFKI